MNDRLSILNIGGHPKDAILYAGGTMAKHVALGDLVCLLEAYNGMRTHLVAIDEFSESGKMPDLGLINSRYTMTVRSSNKQLRIYSWSAHVDRTFAEAPFDPVPGKWYTMKLKVVPFYVKAQVFGKLWVRGEPEPGEWTIGMVDESPNLSGSPGLYGNAQEAEVFVDNVSVVSNQ